MANVYMEAAGLVLLGDSISAAAAINKREVVFPVARSHTCYNLDSRCRAPLSFLKPLTFPHKRRSPVRNNAG
jgi:hypothetical protein